MNKSAIHTMVRHGCDVTIVLCRNSGHYGIIYDAIYKGMLDWVLGNGEQPTDANCTYIPLDITSTYPGERKMPAEPWLRRAPAYLVRNFSSSLSSARCSPRPR